MRSRGFALAASVPLLAAGLAAPASAAPPSAPRPSGAGLANTATFNRPGEGQILKHLHDLVTKAEPGSTIRFTAFRFEEEHMALALMDAAQRGVKIKLLVDGGAPGPTYDRVKKVLDDDGDDATWARACSSDGGEESHSCLGTGSQHNKFVLFSETDGTSNVVSTGSANLNATSGSATWNSWYTHVGDAALYQRFADYFDDMAKMKPDPDYYNTNPPLIIGNIKSYFYPRERVPGDLSGNDTTVHTLQATTCPGTIRIANWSLSRSPLAAELVKKAKEGCDVTIVARKIHKAACEPLADAIGSTGRVEMWSYKQGEGEAPNYVHTKDMMIDAKYPGSTENRVVFTGTPNMNRPSLELNDENLLRIMNDDAMYTRFVDNFQAIRKHAAESGQAFRVNDRSDCGKAWPETA